MHERQTTTLPKFEMSPLTLGEEIDRRLAKRRAQELTQRTYQDLADIYNNELHQSAGKEDEVIEISAEEVKQMEAYNDQLMLLMDEANIVDALEGEQKDFQIIQIARRLADLRRAPGSGLTKKDIGRLQMFWIHLSYVRLHPKEKFAPASTIARLKNNLRSRTGVVPADSTQNELEAVS